MQSLLKQARLREQGHRLWSPRSPAEGAAEEGAGLAAELAGTPAVAPRRLHCWQRSVYTIHGQLAVDTQSKAMADVANSAGLTGPTFFFRQLPQQMRPSAIMIAPAAPMTAAHTKMVVPCKLIF